MVLVKCHVMLVILINVLMYTYIQALFIREPTIYKHDSQKKKDFSKVLCTDMTMIIVRSTFHAVEEYCQTQRC